MVPLAGSTAAPSRHHQKPFARSRPTVTRRYSRSSDWRQGPTTCLRCYSYKGVTMRRSENHRCFAVSTSGSGGRALPSPSSQNCLADLSSTYLMCQRRNPSSATRPWNSGKRCSRLRGLSYCPATLRLNTPRPPLVSRCELCSAAFMNRTSLTQNCCNTFVSTLRRTCSNRGIRGSPTYRPASDINTAHTSRARSERSAD